MPSLKNEDASFQDNRSNVKGLSDGNCYIKGDLWPISLARYRRLRDCHLPREIKEKIPEEWRKRVASEYLDVNLLFGRDVEAALVADKLEKWNLKASVNSHTLYL